MTRFRLTQLLCRLLPPQLSCYLRAIVYPYNKAFEDKICNSRQSVTGSYFSCCTNDYHGYCFAIHGFFDWRNILIGKSLIADDVSSEIIEIGANIGTETVGFADLVGKNGKVHAFEPYPPVLDELKKVSLNNTHLNIQIYPLALGATSSYVDFLIPPEKYSGMGRISVNYDNKNSGLIIKIKVDKLDNYLNDFNNIKAIFIDTEGHETFVLSGATKTIQLYRPVIVLEVSNPLLEQSGKTSMDIFSFFEDLDYECYNIGRFFLTKVKKDNIIKFQRHTNWICIPTGSQDSLFSIKKLLYKHIFLPLIRL